MRCVDCAHCDLRSKPEMARMGFVQCRHTESGTYPSATRQRDCAKFQAATEKAVVDRTKWLAAQAELFKRQIL